MSLTSNQFVLENGYYYPFYLYGDVVYPDYATPYASQAGMFVPVSYDLALSNISAAPIPVSAAQIVSVDPSLVQQ